MGAEDKEQAPPALTAAQMARLDKAVKRLQRDLAVDDGTGSLAGSFADDAQANDVRRLLSALTAAQARIEALERERDAASSHNRELLLHLAEAQANLNDIASRLAVEDARTTLQAKTIRGLEAVIREYLDALDVACNHVMRTDDDFASYEPIDARLEAAEEAMKAAITPPPASTGEEPTR